MIFHNSDRTEGPSRQRLIVWGGAALGGVVALVILFALCGPFVAGAAFRSAMAQAGFPEARFERVQVGAGQSVFEMVTLDSDGFSTIGTVSVTYGFWDLVFRGRVRSLRLADAVLTGEWDSGVMPGLAGWSGSTGGSGVGALPFESLRLENIRVDMATHEGGITLEGDASVSVTPEGRAAFQASIEGKQYQLSLKAALSGKKDTDGNWSAEANIENGRVNLESCKFSRIDGWVSASGGPGTAHPALSGQLTAGKLSAGWIQMQSLNAAIDGTPDVPHLVLGGAAAGVPGLALSAEWKDDALVATLSAEKKTDLQDYLVLTAKSLGRPALPVQAIPKGFSTLTLRLRREATPADQPALRRYSLSLTDAAKTLSARSDMMWDGAMLGGTIETGSMEMGTLGALFPALLPEGWGISGGKTEIQGQIAAGWDASGLRIDGPLKVRLDSVDLDSDVASLEDLSGALVFDSLTPPVTTGVQTLTVAQADIGLPLEDVSAGIRVDPSGALAIQSASGSFAGGRIEAGPFTVRDGRFEKAQVHLIDVDLARAVKAFRSRDVSLSGIVDGQMILSKKPGQAIYAQGKIEARSPGGIVRYAPDPVPSFLAGDDPGLETARLALENLRYDVLSVEFKGPLDGDMETHLIARGANEDAFGDRPVELNLNLQGAIFPLFRLAR